MNYTVHNFGEDRRRMTTSNEEENSQEEAREEFPGLRFHPTEQELVGFYLQRKSRGKLLSNPYIRVVDLYRYDPWELYKSEEEEEEKYMFVEKNEGHRRVTRVTPSGWWKCLGLQRRIWDSRKKLLLGYKKSLSFYIGKAPKGERTEWFMTEFLLPFSEPQNYALCKLHRRSYAYQEKGKEKVKCAEDSICSQVSAAEIRESGVGEVNSYSCVKGVPSCSTAASPAQSLCSEMEISSDHGKDIWEEDWERLFDCASAPSSGYEDGKRLFDFISSPAPGSVSGSVSAGSPAFASASASASAPYSRCENSEWPPALVLSPSPSPASASVPSASAPAFGCENLNDPFHACPDLFAADGFLNADRLWDDLL